MSSLPEFDTIRLRCRASGAETETIETLSQKLDELLQAGLENDDLFAVVIPLLMQGKVRLDVGDTSERLELDDPSLRQSRPNAIRLFELYRAACCAPAPA